MEAAWDQQADRSPSGVQYARHRPEETLLRKSARCNNARSCGVHTPPLFDRGDWDMLGMDTLIENAIPVRINLPHHACRRT
jgi:hypothetical protein